MEEYKVVKVDADCTELNAASVDGFVFCAWIPGPPETWPKALCVRQETTIQRLEHLAAHLGSSEILGQVAALAMDRLRVATEPAPPPEHEEPPAEVPAAPAQTPDPAETTPADVPPADQAGAA